MRLNDSVGTADREGVRVGLTEKVGLMVKVSVLV